MRENVAKPSNDAIAYFVFVCSFFLMRLQFLSIKIQFEFLSTFLPCADIRRNGETKNPKKNIQQYKSIKYWKPLSSKRTIFQKFILFKEITRRMRLPQQHIHLGKILSECNYRPSKVDKILMYPIKGHNKKPFDSSFCHTYLKTFASPENLIEFAKSRVFFSSRFWRSPCGVRRKYVCWFMRYCSTYGLRLFFVDAISTKIHAKLRNWWLDIIIVIRYVVEIIAVFSAQCAGNGRWNEKLYGWPYR